MYEPTSSTTNHFDNYSSKNLHLVLENSIENRNQMVGLIPARYVDTEEEKKTLGSSRAAVVPAIQVEENNFGRVFQFLIRLTREFDDEDLLL